MLTISPILVNCIKTNQKNNIKQINPKTQQKNSKAIQNKISIAPVFMGNVVFAKPNNQLLKNIEKAIKKDFLNPNLDECYVKFFEAKDYINALKKGGFNIKKYLTAGGESLVFELNDGNILKLSPIKYNFSIKGLNPPEISRGKITFESSKGKNQNIYYLIQKKIITDTITQEELNTLNEIAQKEGCILIDSILKGGIIKQSNFGHYIDENGIKKPCVVDLGVLKRKSERYAFEELVKMADNREIIKKGEFSAHLSQTIFKKIIDSDNCEKNVEDIIEEFIQKASTSEEKPLNIMQEILKSNGLNPIKEFNIN